MIIDNEEMTINKKETADQLQTKIKTTLQTNCLDQKFPEGSKDGPLAYGRPSRYTSGHASGLLLGILLGTPLGTPQFWKIFNINQHQHKTNTKLTAKRGLQRKTYHAESSRPIGLVWLAGWAGGSRVPIALSGDHPGTIVVSG